MTYHWAIVLFPVFFQCVLTLNQQEINALEEIKTKWNVSDLPGGPNCSTWSRHLRCNDHLNAISLDIGFATPELLSGSIPEALCNLTFLEELKLYGNRLSGTIPNCIGDLVYLKYLDFSGNCLGGEIPESLGNLTRMEYFDLSVNHHNGFSFSHRDLCKKSFQSNGLTGTIPASLGKMNKVQYFYLSGNQLTGPMPASIGNLSNVMYIYINANNISGSLPRTIGKLQKLQDLQLNKNNITGVIPREIGNCSSLRIIQMNRNHLSGVIPDTIGDLAQLQAFEVLNNQLEGQIPEFKTTPVLDLNLFDVRGNNLSGPLPKSFGDAPLRYLLLSNNTNLRGIDNKLPDYIRPDFMSRSVVDEERHFDCPGFALLSRVFEVTAPLIQLDPEYYNYTLCNCRPGFFGIPPDQCRTCLPNGDCRGLVVKSSMRLRRGFFPVTDDVGNLQGLVPCDMESLHPRDSPCNPNDDCFYGKNGLQAMSGNCTPCFPHMEGRFCSKCSCSRQECYYHFREWECIRCKSIPSLQVVLCSIAVILTLTLFAFFHNSSLVRLLLIIILVSLALALDSGSWLYLNILLVFIILIPATSIGLSSGLVKSLIFFVQTTMAMIPPSWNYAVSYASRNFMSFSNMKFIGLVCLFPQILGISKHAPLYRFILSLCAPIMIFFSVLVFLVFKKVLLYVCRRVGFHSRNPATSMRTEILFAFVFIAYFSFFNASTLVISVFSCSIDHSGHEYMNAKHYSSVKCHSSEWHYMAIAAAVGAFFLVLLPLVIFTSLLFKYKSSLDDPALSSWLGYLYESYKPRDASTSSKLRNSLWIYFEIVYMVFRFSLGVNLSILNSQSLLKAPIIAILLIVLLTVFVGFEPYTRSVDNNAAITSIMTLILTLIFSQEVQKHDTNYTGDNYITLLFFTGAINGLTVLMFFVLIVRSGKEKLRSNVRSLKEAVLYCYERITACRNSNFTENQEPCLEDSIQE